MTKRADETELRGRGRLLFGGKSLAISFVFWRRNDRDVGNGLVFAPIVALIEAARTTPVHLELERERRIAVWLDNLLRDNDQASFYTE